MNTTNIWAKRLKNYEMVFGTHVFGGFPMLTEAIALAGFDMIWIDMEHTAITADKVLNNLIAVRAGGVASVVRIPWNDPVLAKPVLDMGPDAIIFPYIRTVQDARKAVTACEYPPVGVRGYGPLRALDYGAITPGDYVDEMYKNTLRFVQIEHIDAVECLEEIADLPGIDAFIVGPNDLAGSLGHIGRPNCAEMQPVYDRLARVLLGKKPFGVSMGMEPEYIHLWIDRGANILFAGNDVGFVHDGAKLVREQFSALLAQRDERRAIGG